MVGSQRARAHRVNPVDVHDALAAPDYVDTVEIGAGSRPRTAEQWARATLEGAPAALRWLLVLGWRTVLGIRLGPRTGPGHVLGWQILSATPGRVVLGTQARVLGPTRLVFDADGSRVLVASCLRYERRGARAIWSVAGLVHRRTVPWLLTRAARSAARG